MSARVSPLSRTPQSGPPGARSRRRRGIVLALAAALAIPAAVLVAPSAFAADGPFVIDGTVPDPNTAELEDPEGNVKELGPLNSNTTKIGVIHADAVPTLGLTNPNGQVDLRRAWLDTEREGTKDWLYFAWEREPPPLLIRARRRVSASACRR